MKELVNEIKTVNRSKECKPYPPKKKTTTQYEIKNRSSDIDIDKSYSVKKSIRLREKRKVKSNNITFYSGRFVDSITDLIKKHSVVLGCVAWLSNVEVLKSLKTLDCCAFIVGYEKYLIKDETSKGKWPEKMRSSYRQLNPVPFNKFNGRLFKEDGLLDSVKYIGFSGMKRVYMHNKFMIFGDVKDGKINPACVWTGSVNFSQNTDKLLDNAVLIHDKTIVKCYYDLFQELSTFSESFDYSI